MRLSSLRLGHRLRFRVSSAGTETSMALSVRQLARLRSRSGQPAGSWMVTRASRLPSTARSRCSTPWNDTQTPRFAARYATPQGPGLAAAESSHMPHHIFNGRVLRRGPEISRHSA